LNIGYVKYTDIGESVFANNLPSPHIPHLFNEFNDAQLPARQLDNLDSLIWGKLIVNAGINALTEILRVRNCKLDTHPDTYQLVMSSTRPSPWHRHSANHGPTSDPVAHVTVVHAQLDPTVHQPSMLRGGSSEINGAIITTAQIYGIAAPYNTILTELMATIDS